MSLSDLAHPLRQGGGLAVNGTKGKVFRVFTAFWHSFSSLLHMI